MNRDTMIAGAMGAAGGAAVGVVLWLVFRGVIDQQVSATIAREVPPRLRQELDSKLAQYGITPQMGQGVARMLSAFEQGGVFSAIGR